MRPSNTLFHHEEREGRSLILRTLRILGDLLRKYRCGGENEAGDCIPSYPRKRVSRLIWRDNLDSRVRGNDKSRRAACERQSSPLSCFVSERKLMNHFVASTPSQ